MIAKANTILDRFSVKMAIKKSKKSSKKNKGELVPSVDKTSRRVKVVTMNMFDIF